MALTEEDKLDFLNKTLVPKIRGLYFPPKSSNSSSQFIDDSDNNQNLNIILPSVACFLLGVILVAIAAYVLYCRVKGKDLGRERGDAPSLTTDNPKFAIFQNNPLGEFFLYKEGIVSDDTQSALNLLATPFVFESKLNDGLDAREQSLFEIQNEIDRETRGESTTDEPYIDTQVDLLKDAVPAYQDVIWSVPDSDVRVTIPTAALPKTRGQSSIKVALGANPLNVTTSGDEIQLTPLLILSSPNITRYNKPIELRLPHRANLYTENDWEFILRYSGTAENNINKLHWKDGVKDMNNETTGHDVSYRYDNDFIYLKTYFPGLFCAVGSGTRKKRPLNVAVVAYAYPLPPQTCEPEPGQEIVKTGVDIKVFLIDSFREAIQHLKKTEEEENGGMCISQPLPMRMINEKDWRVNLISADWPQWAWTLHEGQRLRSMTSECLYNDLGIGASVQFRIFTKPNTENQSETFEATFSLSQKRKKAANVVTYVLVTRPFPIPKSNSSMGSDCQVRLLDFPDPFSSDIVYS